MPTPMDGHGDTHEICLEKIIQKKLVAHLKMMKRKMKEAGNGNGDDKKDNGKKDDGRTKATN